MSDNSIIIKDIQKRIYTLRGVQVMLDEELAELYDVPTKVLNQADKRNIDRFPAEFMFQVSETELEILRSQFVTSSWGGRRYMPYAFTEQGVAMLSTVLRSETAIKVSIQIMNAFVAMRRFLQVNAQVFHRLDTLELKQTQTDQKIERILTAIEEKSAVPKQGIFYEGQVFDAWSFASDLIRSAKKSILLIDNYIDDTVLTLFAKRSKGVSVTLLAKNPSRQLELDVQKFNQQYESVVLKNFAGSHDRFMIIDETDLYHIGASLKDLGKKWFAFSKMDIQAIAILENLKKVGLV
jgi:hypothetical protein